MVSLIADKVDNWYKKFGPGNKFVIWGCSDFAEQLIRKLGNDLDISFIVDKNEKLNGTEFCGIPVKIPDVLVNNKDVKVIISNTYMGTRAKIASSLKEMGFAEDEDFTYIEKVFSIYCWKKHSQIGSQYAEISITSFCSLKCKNCTAYMPYVKDRKHFSLEELMASTNLYFSSVDYVGRFRVLGGEPMLSPCIGDYISYIGDHYRDRIGELCIVTNGTIKFSPEMISLLKKYKVTLFISNYSCCGHPLASKDRYDELLHLMDENRIPYHFTDSQKWLELGNPLKADSEETDEVLKDRFDDCQHYCRSILYDKIYMCATWAFATIGGLYDKRTDASEEDGILDMNSFISSDKEERFYRWYSFDIDMNTGNGYLDFCRYCKGFGSKNTNFVPVGEQV